MISNIGDIISDINVILQSRHEIVVNKECMMVEIIFDKFQTSKSNFEQVNEKMNKDPRLSRILGNVTRKKVN